MTKPDAIEYNEKDRQLLCQGDWDVAHLPELQQFLNSIKWPKSGDLVINGKGITKMDSAGAWLIGNIANDLENKKLKVKLKNFSEQHQKLLELVKSEIEKEEPVPKVEKASWVARVGKQTLNGLLQFQDYLAFVGLLTMETLGLLLTPWRWRWNALFSIIFSAGYLALPIIALLSFMIGVVITYQMGLQLQNYGANIYIVDLLGLSITREFAPLLTAIMVAGRTGSAFTAQLGMMKLNQEIDALDTLGVPPGELLILPRIIGLTIALPLLTMWSDIFGIFGGMVMANNMLDISWYDFLQRFPHVIPLRSLIIGLGKAPVFALVISSVGCYEGMKVQGGAESVGTNTTRSVVLSIFFIIVVDAIFSVILSKLKL